MAIDSNQLYMEEKYLESVLKILNDYVKELSKKIDTTKSSINEMKKFVWESANQFTDEERSSAFYEIDSSVGLTNISIDALNRYQKALKSPYFAKVTFKEENEEVVDVYIGMSSIQKNQVFYVFDWRAPISSLFYNFETGPASYECPNGEISGEILSKMQIKIEDGHIIRCFNSDINIDDEYLQEILANSSSDKMRNIVSTIQREQNLIIRNEKDKNLIVQGSAGSGKTSVALHRIAYLLYKDVYLNSNNVLILSPNDVFSNYISDVLPELGENNVLKTTYSEFAKTFLKTRKRIESYTDFLERVYSLHSEINKEELTYKMSNKYKEDIDSFLEEYENGITMKTITLGNKSVPRDELEYMFKVKYKKLPYKERIDAMVEEVCLKLRLPYKKNQGIIKKYIVNSSNISLDPFELYGMISNTSSKMILYEDISPLLYITFKVNELPSYSNIRQVVIDEVQDYTLFQIELLKKIFKNASFTLLGDINQTINPYYSYESLQSLSSLFESSRYLELNKTYRSTGEIIDYSNDILDISNAVAVRKSGDYPVLVTEAGYDKIANMVGRDISLMLSNGHKRVAVITKNIETAREIYSRLHYPEAQLLTKASDVIESNIIVIPSYLSKGLEFDGVIIYNQTDEDYGEEERKLYYVACTRAQHELSIYNEPKMLKMKRKIKDY